MFPPDTHLGRYTIRERLGSGGMGDVFLALDPTLDRKVAVKVLPEEFSSDSARLARFVREARTVSALNHPNILTVHDFGQEGATHFLVTELVDGRTFRAWAGEARPSLVDLLGVIAQAATALSAAHEAGVVHRDVKPENLMLRRDGLVKVLDFGIAKLTSRAFAGLEAGANTTPAGQTAPGTILGTVRYMSPEQAAGLEVDARTDVWSLGVVLYELLAGRPPFKEATPVGTLAAILERDPTPLAEAAPGTPEVVCRIVAKALCKRREDRYETAARLAVALERARLDLGAGVGLEVLQAQTQEDVETRALPMSAAEPDEEIVDNPQRQPAALPPTNLTLRVSALIGREREIGEITGLLRGGAVRLLTLTGPGGTGKTRLAVEAGRLLLPDFADGVFAVDLTPLTDPQLLASHIAQTLRLKEVPGTTIAEQLAQHLAERQLLLVLDNFEHLLVGARLVAELLGAAPQLRVLATSRALLRLSTEREYAVEPLELPSGTSLAPLEAVARTAAVALFLERACAAKPAFALTAENAAAVVGICRRLEGLPLAIELAAARVKLLSSAALLARLDARLKLLTGGARDLPERQQTMRGAIAWSYDLLEEPERELLRRLAVFVGGCTLSAVEALCGAEDLGVLDGLSSLLDNSLLRQRDEADGEGRFLMLEVVREFALEQLEAHGEAEAARQAHAGYFLQLAEETEPEFTSPRLGEWLARLEAEHDNLRTALGFLLERDGDASLRLAAAVRGLWHMHAHYTEGRQWLAAALERSSSAPTLVRAKALGAASNLAQQQGDAVAARGYQEERLRIGRQTGDPRQVGWASFGLAIGAHQQGDLPTARAHAETCLACAREVGDDRLVGHALNALGEVAREECAWVEARAHYEQALAVYKQVG